MATYLCCNINGAVKSFTAKNASEAGKNYLRVSNGYFPLTTETTIGNQLKVRSGGSEYRIVETYTTTVSKSTTKSSSAYNSYDVYTYYYRNTRYNSYTNRTTAKLKCTLTTQWFNYSLFDSRVFKTTSGYDSVFNDGLKDLVISSSSKTLTSYRSSSTLTLTTSTFTYYAVKEGATAYNMGSGATASFTAVLVQSTYYNNSGGNTASYFNLSEMKNISAWYSKGGVEEFETYYTRGTRYYYAYFKSYLTNTLTASSISYLNTYFYWEYTTRYSYNYYTYTVHDNIFHDSRYPAEFGYIMDVAYDTISYSVTASTTVSTISQ